MSRQWQGLWQWRTHNSGCTHLESFGKYHRQAPPQTSHGPISGHGLNGYAFKGSLSDMIWMDSHKCLHPSPQRFVLLFWRTLSEHDYLRFLGFSFLWQNSNFFKSRGRVWVGGVVCVCVLSPTSYSFMKPQDFLLIGNFTWAKSSGSSQSPSYSKFASFSIQTAS